VFDGGYSVEPPESSSLIGIGRDRPCAGTMPWELVAGGDAVAGGVRPMSDAQPEQSPTHRRVVLTGIGPRAWEHPADRGALTALRELRGFDEIVKALNGLWNERGWRLQFLGSAMRVDHRQYPRLHRLMAEAAASLDIAELPELYVQLDRNLNAMCVGMAKPFIVVNSGALELLDDEELRCLLGHELGHLISGHAVYKTISVILHGMVIRLSWLPVGALILRGVEVALQEWWRKAELSADRAGLLACQDPAAAQRLAMKLAGGGNLTEVDTTAFLEQAAEYDRAGDLRDSVLKLLLVMGRSHPLPVARAAELRRWIDSGEYARVLSGRYPRRDDEPGPVSEDVREAARSYRESFARSQDPLVSLLRQVGNGASGVGEWVSAGAGRVRGWMRPPAGPERGSSADGTAEPRADQ
jgi:Zn-dependent protease with chaperone function